MAAPSYILRWGDGRRHRSATTDFAATYHSQMGARSRRPSASVYGKIARHIWVMISPSLCATQIPARGNSIEEPRQEHEGGLNEDCHGTQGAAVTWTALTGRVVRRGENQWLPAQTPKREGAHDAQGLQLRRVGKESTG